MPTLVVSGRNRRYVLQSPAVPFPEDSRLAKKVLPDLDIDSIFVGKNRFSIDLQILKKYGKTKLHPLYLHFHFFRFETVVNDPFFAELTSFDRKELSQPKLKNILQPSSVGW